MAWTFSLSADATISLATGRALANGRDLDTVMYQYQQNASGTWGRYIERNEDASSQDRCSAIRDTELGGGAFSELPSQRARHNSRF